MSLIYFVYGHCRSTTGGYDIWSECDGHKMSIFSESNIRNTTINKMNYLAMTKLLEYLTPPLTHNDDHYSSSSSLPRLTIVCNCRLMYKQLCGLLESKVLKEEYGKTIKLLNELKTTHHVNIISCDTICPPSIFK